MTLLIAMVAMFGLNSCDVFNEEKGSPEVEFGWDQGNGKLGFGDDGIYMVGAAAELRVAIKKAIASEGFTELGYNRYVSIEPCTNSEAKSLVKRIVNKVNIDQYKVEIDKDFVVRYKIDGDTYTDVYRKNLSK